MVTEDLYELLGVNKNASQNEIKKAYRKKAKEHHPDVGGDDEYFKKISYANEILSDTEKRKLYDQFGHDMGKSVNVGAPTDLRDFIRRTQEQFFGNFQEQQGPPPIRLNVSLTLKEMYDGTNKKFKYNVNRVCSHCNGLKYISSEGGNKEVCQNCNGTGKRMTQEGMMTFIQTCQHCGGTGYIIKNGCKHCNTTGFEKVEQTISIDIPKGIFNGAYINFEGKGNEFIINGKSIIGDLIVVINEIQSSDFIREGDDLHCFLNVPIIDCILGEEITVETIDNKKRKFKLKIGTESDDKFRLPGLGMPIINTNNFGNLYVHIKHKMLKELSEKEIELLNELKKLKENEKLK